MVSLEQSVMAFYQHTCKTSGDEQLPAFVAHELFEIRRAL